MPNRLPVLLTSIDVMLHATTTAQWRSSRSAYVRAARNLRSSDVDDLLSMLPTGSDDEPRMASFRRSRMMMALAYAPERHETIPVLKSLLHDDSQLTRTFAATSLGMMGADAHGSGRMLLKLVGRASNPTVKYAAWQALKQITPREATTKARYMSWYWRVEYAVPEWCMVYGAEYWLKPQTFGEKYESLADVDVWLKRVRYDSWFLRRFRHLDWFLIELHDGRGSRCATGDYENDVCHLTLPRFATQLIILHELSHSLAIAAGKHDGHRRGFCRIYLALVGHFLGHEACEDLRLNLRTFDYAGECL